MCVRVNLTHLHIVIWAIFIGFEVCSPLPVSAQHTALELPDCMDEYYGAKQWQPYSDHTNSGTDIGPAMSRCLQKLRQSPGRRGVLHVPAGSWSYKTAVDSKLLNGNYLIGDGSQASQIVVQFATGAAFAYSGADGLTGGGMKGLGLMIGKGLGMTRTTAILLQGDPVDQPDQTTWEDLYISSGAADTFWYACVQANGTARSAPQGIRVATWNNIQCFRSSSYGIHLANVVQWTMSNVGIYSGTNNGNDFYLSGGNARQTYTTEITIQRLSVSGTLLINNSLLAQIWGSAKTCVIDAKTTAYYAGWLACGTKVGAFGSHSDVKVAGK
jgi:hypothetical protein